MCFHFTIGHSSLKTRKKNPYGKRRFIDKNLRILPKVDTKKAPRCYNEVKK